MRAHPGRTLSVLVAGVALVGGVLVACDKATHVPPGAQQVHVVGTGTEVRLDPPTVHAGDVYLVIDGSALFFQAQRSAEESPGPLAEDELTRIAQSGDTFHTWSTELSPGYAGNVYKYTLAAGKYAFVPVPDENAPGDELMVRADLCYRDPQACAALPPLPIVVLDVVP